MQIKTWIRSLSANKSQDTPPIIQYPSKYFQKNPDFFGKIQYLRVPLNFRVDVRNSQHESTKFYIFFCICYFFVYLDCPRDFISAIFGIFGKFRFYIEKIRNKNFRFFRGENQFWKCKSKKKSDFFDFFEISEILLRVSL